MRSTAGCAMLAALAVLGTPAAVRAEALDPAIDTLTSILNEPPQGASQELAGVWAGGGTCILIESYTKQGTERLYHDLSGVKPEHWSFGSLTIVKDGTDCRVEPDSARAGLSYTLTSSCDEKHVHAEYIKDAGVRGDTYDFTLEGDKLIGTHTDFDNYHGSREVHRCELEKSHRLTPEEVEELRKYFESQPSSAQP